MPRNQNMASGKFHKIPGQFLAFTLALLVLIATSGVFISAHQCHGRTSSFALTGIELTSQYCACKTDAFLLSKSGENLPALHKSACCKNINQFSKLLLPATVQHTLHKISLNTAFIIPELLIVPEITAEQEIPSYPGYLPPLLLSGRTLLIALNQLRIPLA